MTASMWSDYLDLPETQFFLHHWPAYLLMLVVFAAVVVTVRHAWR